MPGNILCGECAKSLPNFRKKNVIPCAMCKRVYDPIWTSSSNSAVVPNRTLGCDGLVTDDRLEAGALSELQGRYVYLYGDKPTGLKIGTSICDGCIQRMLDTGLLHPSESPAGSPMTPGSPTRTESESDEESSSTLIASPSTAIGRNLKRSTSVTIVPGTFFDRVPKGYSSE